MIGVADRAAAGQARRSRAAEAERRARLEREADLLAKGDPVALARNLLRNGSEADRAMLAEIVAERRATVRTRGSGETGREAAATARRRERAEAAELAHEAQMIDPRDVEVCRIGSALHDVAGHTS